MLRTFAVTRDETIFILCHATGHRQMLAGMSNRRRRTSPSVTLSEVFLCPRAIIGTGTEPHYRDPRSPVRKQGAIEQVVGSQQSSKLEKRIANSEASIRRSFANSLETHNSRPAPSAG